jgi:hypothetical protein
MAGLLKTRPSGQRLVRSYGGDLRSWMGGIVKRYEIAAAILVGGLLALLVAIGFGIAAVFHFVALRYGENVALAGVGGFFAVLGIIGFIAGLAMLKRRIPPVPRPQRQFDEFRRSIAVPATLQLLSRNDRVRAIARDPVAQIILAVSGALALGWIVAASRTSKRRM